MKKRTLLGCLVAAALPSLLNAQEAVSDSLHTALQEVEIMSIRATETTPVAYTNIGREEIKRQKEELQKAFYDLSAKIYQQANPDGQGIDPSQFANMGGEAASPSDDGVVDADFTEV